jgi:hypothetical protein
MNTCWKRENWKGCSVVSSLFWFWAGSEKTKEKKRFCKIFFKPACLQW